MRKTGGKKPCISLVGKVSKKDIEFRELLELYERDCRRRGIEEITIKGYRFACEKFLDYLKPEDFSGTARRRQNNINAKTPGLRELFVIDSYGIIRKNNSSRQK